MSAVARAWTEGPRYVAPVGQLDPLSLPSSPIMYCTGRASTNPDYASSKFRAADAKEPSLLL